MARERMVTRTVNVTIATTICMDVVNVDTQIKDLELSGTYTNEKELLKALKKAYETDTYKVVAIQETYEKEILYGMKEIEFIKLATILPPRGAKEIEEEV